MNWVPQDRVAGFSKYALSEIQILLSVQYVMLSDNPGVRAFMKQTSLINYSATIPKVENQDDLCTTCLGRPSKGKCSEHQLSSQSFLLFFLVADTALDPTDPAFTNQAT